MPIFAGLPAGDLAAIAPAFQPCLFARGARLFAEGEPPASLFLIESGHLKLVKHSEDGRDIILRIAMPGDLLGGVSAFGRRPHPFTAQAMVPVAALRVAGADFAAIMAAQPIVARWTVDVLTEQLVEAHDAMKSLATERAERRIARQLVKLADVAGRPVAEGVAITVPLSRQDLADLAGTTVETAIRVLSRWRRAGLVAGGGRALVLVDPERLLAGAGGRGGASRGA